MAAFWSFSLCLRCHRACSALRAPSTQASTRGHLPRSAVRVAAGQGALLLKESVEKAELINDTRWCAFITDQSSFLTRLLLI